MDRLRQGLPGPGMLLSYRLMTIQRSWDSMNMLSRCHSQGVPVIQPAAHACAMMGMLTVTRLHVRPGEGLTCACINARLFAVQGPADL